MGHLRVIVLMIIFCYRRRFALAGEKVQKMSRGIGAANCYTFLFYLKRILILFVCVHGTHCNMGPICWLGPINDQSWIETESKSNSNQIIFEIHILSQLIHAYADVPIFLTARIGTPTHRHEWTLTQVYATLAHGSILHIELSLYCSLRVQHRCFMV